MIIPIPTHKKRISIRIGLRAIVPIVIGIVAYNPLYSNTHYFHRKVTFLKAGSYREIIVKLPITPKKLALEIYDYQQGGTEDFEVEKFKIEPLAKKEVWIEQSMLDFIDFAQNFCEKAGVLKNEKTDFVST